MPESAAQKPADRASPATPISSARRWRCQLASTVAAVAVLIATIAQAQERLPPVPADPSATDANRRFVEERLRALEEANYRLNQQYDDVARQNQQLAQQIANLTQSPSSPAAGDLPAPAATHGRSFFENQPPDVRTDEPAPTSNSTATTSVFDEGFKWETKDEEYSLILHSEMQLDVRAYGQNDSDPVNQLGFYISRIRMIMNGHLTEPIEYNLSINKGIGDLDLLDAYLNFNYDERLQLRVGRFRVPFTYDWYALSNQFLLTPERSVFAINEGYNRNWAAMLHGELCDERIDYALAAVNGPRNSYFDTNSDKDLLSYLNVRPFQQSERFCAFQHLNLGGSAAIGIEDQEAKPIDFRTSINATDSEGALEEAPSFLRLRTGAIESGLRNMWEVHAAWYYRQLSLLAALDGGFNDYALESNPTRVRVPVHAWHAQFGYFITGEEIQRRSFVEPLRPFDLRPEKRGCGAIELQARYEDYSLGREIFTGGIADPALWTNRVRTVDAGVNWYLNKYTKIYLDWQHSMFDSPVPFRPGGFQSTSDLYWLRFQIYF